MHRSTGMMLYMAILSLAHALFTATAQGPSDKAQLAPPITGFEFKGSLQAYSYTFELWTRDADDYLRIIHDGKLVEWFDGERFQVVGGNPLSKVESFFPELMNVSPEVPLDFDGDGKNEVLVAYWTEGMHCCAGCRVFSVSDTLKLTGDIKFEHGDGRLVDLDHDGRPEWEMEDWTYAYWPADFATSPSPRIVIGYRDGEFQAIPELMLMPAPTNQEWRSTEKKVKHDFKHPDLFYPPPALWRGVLDLVYSGNAPSAWKLSQETWPKSEPKPDSAVVLWANQSDFRNAVMAKLKTSPYWNAIKSLNGW